jgi:kumamolisin
MAAQRILSVPAQQFRRYQSGPGGQARGKTACHDITVGQNASNPEPGVEYEARSGFDAASGWGTRNGAALLAAHQS